jgi:uncharacterized protein YecT (DUF1311 family)
MEALMRALLFGLTMLIVPAAAYAGTDIVATCYKDCEAQTHSNPEYKACVARGAGKDMSQDASAQIAYFKDAQKQWIAYRDSNCTLEDSLAFGGTAIGGNYSSCLCALSYQRIDDFERMQKHVMGEP